LEKGDHADVFTLLVRWSDTGAVTAWTGTCAVNSKIWARANLDPVAHRASHTGVEWDHIITGSEVLVPIE